MNIVALIGRLTKDPELRKTTSGISVCTFTVAVDRRTKKDDSEQQTADFIQCVAWRQSAEFLTKYARKGALISVSGRIQTRNYDRQDGTRVYITEVVTDNVQLLESRTQSEARSNQNTNGDEHRPAADKSEPAETAVKQKPEAETRSTVQQSQMKADDMQWGHSEGQIEYDPMDDVTIDDLPF